MNQPRYLIRKRFRGGLLDGLTYDEITTVRFEVGQVVERPVGGSPYFIESVELLPPTHEAYERYF